MLNLRNTCFRCRGEGVDGLENKCDKCDGKGYIITERDGEELKAFLEAEYPDIFNPKPKKKDIDKELWGKLTKYKLSHMTYDSLLNYARDLEIDISDNMKRKEIEAKVHEKAQEIAQGA